MAAPPLRTEICDTYPLPSDATARAGFGKLWDYVTGLLGATGNAPEARVALGAVGTSGNETVAGVKTFSSRPIFPMQSMVRLHTPNGYGSTNTAIRRYTTVAVNQGSDIAYADSATLGASFTINTAGVYSMYIMDQSTVSMFAGISQNSTQLTTGIISITAADRLAEASNYGVGNPAAISVTAYLAAGTVIRPHCGGEAAAGTRHQFTIARVD